MSIPWLVVSLTLALLWLIIVYHLEKEPENTPMGYKRPPLTKAETAIANRAGARLARAVYQDDLTDELASALVGRTIEGLTVELQGSGDNLLRLQVTRNVYNNHGDLVKVNEDATVVFNELGIGLRR